MLAAQAYADLGREDEALDHAMRAASLAPLSEDAHALVGTLLARRGRVAEALMAFDRALYLAPEAPLVRFQFAGLLRDMGRSARARREFVNLAAWLERLPPEETVGELSARLLASACRDQAEKLK